MNAILQDLRYAGRSLRNAPAFTAVAAGTLALGIGANAAMFRIVDRVLLKPLPFRQPGALVQVIETWNGGNGYGPPSWKDFQDWARDARSFEGLVGYRAGAGNLERRGEPERLRLVETTANLFDVLGVRPAFGRSFRPGEDAPGAACVVVLSDPLWKSHFGAAPGAVGTSVRINGAPCSIVGVAPPRFEFPVGLGDGLWTAISPEGPLYADRGSHFLQTVGRLRPGVSSAAASAEMDGIMRRIARSFPEAAPNRSGRVVPLRLWASSDYREKLYVLSAAVAVVLLIACVNLASMLLARSTTRRRELAIRAALGASRGRLVSQMIVESAVLATVGAAAGLLVAAGGLGLLSSSIQRYVGSREAIAMDQRTLLFGLATGAVTVLLFGLLPALHAARAEATTLRGEMAGSGRTLQRLRGALVSGETALSLLLLSAAILLARTLVALQRQDAGMSADRVMTFKTSPAPRNYPNRSLDPAFYAPLRARLERIPGVRAVGMVNRLPLEAWGISGTFRLDGRPAPADPNDWYAEKRVVSPGYFTAIGAVLARGREFSSADSAESPKVAIVNEAFVRRYLGTQNPLETRLRMDASAPPMTVVGVYRSVRQRGLGREADPEIDLPSTQILPGDDLYEFGLAATETFVVRCGVRPESLVETIRRAVREVDPRQPVFAFRTLDEVRDASMGGDRLTLSMLGAFAGIALVLCLAGIYGVMSYFVARRTREIGVRMALGATQGNILGLVVRSALRLAAVGVALGLAGALVAGGALRSLLFGVQPTDPSTLALAALCLLATAAAAAYLPARRAARVEPTTALRVE
jgi:putative ABC transport system permease protein